MQIVPGQSFTLKDETKFIRVIEGRLEVYAATKFSDDKKADSKFFRQMFLTEISAGDAAYPALDAFEQIEIILKAAEKVEVEILNFDAVAPHEQIELMRHWFSRLADLPSIKFLADRGDEDLNSWRNGTIFQSKETLYQNKESLYQGKENLYQDKEISDEIYREFSKNESTLSMLLGAGFASDDKQFLEQINTREEFHKALYEESIARLLGEEPQSYAKSVSDLPRLEEAAFIVNRVIHALKLPEVDLNLTASIVKKLDRVGLLHKLARKGNFYLRRIQMSKGWHKQDNGVIIGYYSEKEELAAFIPLSPEKYILVTKKNPAGIEITDEIATKIAPFAYVCYAGLPTTKLTMSDILKFIWRRLWADDWSAILTASFIAGVTAIITPIITQTVFEDIVPIFDREGLATVTQVAIMTCFTTAIVSIVRSMAVLRITTNVDMAIEAAIIGRVFSFPSKFFREFQVGDLAKRLTGITEIKNIFSTQTVASFFNLVFAFWSLILMFYYSIKLTLLAMLIWVVYVSIMLLIYRNLVIYNRGKIAAKNKTAAILQQLFSGLAKFRMQGAESSAFWLWSKNFSEEANYNLKYRWQMNYHGILSSIEPLIASLIIYYFVADLMKDAVKLGENPFTEVISYASFMAFQTAFTGFNTTINGFFPVIAQYFSIKPHIENLQPIFEEVPEVNEDKTESNELTGLIELKHVTFSYSENSPDILKDISLRIEAGKNIAIVGRSGCGKSTLLRLLLGFDKPKSGGIYYDGQDLNDLDLSSVRSQMGVVLQNGQLMTGDIFSNIVGTMNLTQDDAWAAAEAAGIADDIRNMPMGMNTLLSEGSGNISGGQRQRILIARALAAKPSIIIFDEATSALDNRTQAIVTESLKKMKATRIVVAHRLSTIRDCDFIFVINKGVIAESGSFDELIAKGGLFAELIKNQTAT